MPYSELTVEAITGLETYKSELITMHQNVKPIIDPEVIREYLRDEGMVTSTPFVTIPYEVETLASSAELGSRNNWVDPFTVKYISRANNQRVKRAEGKSAWETGFPGGFWSVVLDVAVVFDDFRINTADYGLTYATGYAANLAAHEITHSAFARVSSRKFRKTGDSIVVSDKCGISQAPEVSVLSRGDATVPTYNPMWIDEAFAQYMAGVVRERLHPETMPAKPRVVNLSAYGIDEIELPANCLIMSDTEPDYPGPCAGLERLAFDILAVKKPNLIPNIKALTTGKLCVVSFLDVLRHDIGTELFTAITERRPYSSWAGIYDQVKDL